MLKKSEINNLEVNSKIVEELLSNSIFAPLLKYIIGLSATTASANAELPSLIIISEDIISSINGLSACEAIVTLSNPNYV